MGSSAHMVLIDKEKTQAQKEKTQRLDRKRFKWTENNGVGD